MKHLFTLAAALFMAANAFAYEGGDIITLDLTKASDPASYSYTSAGLWDGTYGTSNPWLQFQVFKIGHCWTGNASYGSGYWDGFTMANSGDTSNAGNGNSTEWVNHQDGCMAGGGVATEPSGEISKKTLTTALATKGNPYLVAYWSAWGDKPSNVIKFAKVNGDSVFEAVGVYVTNHPWPYYSLKNGDSFARAFNKEGDSFKIIAHGVLRDTETKSDSIEIGGFKNGTLTEATDWTYFDLSSLGNISSLYFTMSSTDSGEWGINTATYFCMDKLQIKVIPTTGVNKVDENAVRVYFDRAAQEVVAADGAQVNVFNMQGQQVLSATGSRVSLASLADGLYIVKSAGQTLKIAK